MHNPFICISQDMSPLLEQPDNHSLKLSSHYFTYYQLFNQKAIRFIYARTIVRINASCNCKSDLIDLISFCFKAVSFMFNKSPTRCQTSPVCLYLGLKQLCDIYHSGSLILGDSGCLYIPSQPTVKKNKAKERLTDQEISCDTEAEISVYQRPKRL